MKDIDKKEKISMLMDDHWERFEQDSIITELKSDSESLATWRRYHVIGDALRRNGSLCQTSICSKVMDRLASEPTVLAPRWRVPKINRWVKDVGIGSAVAAAILIAIIMVPIGQNDGVSEGPVVADMAPITPIPSVQHSGSIIVSNPDAQRKTDIEKEPQQVQSDLVGGAAGIPELATLMKAHNTTLARGFSGHIRTARTASLVINKTSANP